jgi:hypothetical protein
MNHCHTTTTHKIPNSATTATSQSIPNTIVMRDSDSGTRVSSLILKGADFIKSNVSPELLTNGFLYFTSQDNHHYAILRNTETNTCALNLSLEFGENNPNGNFMILTEQQTNFTVCNNRVGINTKVPEYTLDVDGPIRSTELSHSGPVHSTEHGLLKNVPPYHIKDALLNVPFKNNSIFVFEVSMNLILPTDMYDGYQAVLINKSGSSVYIQSTEPMFTAWYLPPDGGNLFILENHAKINIIYTKTPTGSSWNF